MHPEIPFEINMINRRAYPTLLTKVSNVATVSSLKIYKKKYSFIFYKYVNKKRKNNKGIWNIMLAIKHESIKKYKNIWLGY